MLSFALIGCWDFSGFDATTHDRKRPVFKTSSCVALTKFFAEKKGSVKYPSVREASDSSK